MKSKIRKEGSKENLAFCGAVSSMTVNELIRALKFHQKAGYGEDSVFNLPVSARMVKYANKVMSGNERKGPFDTHLWCKDAADTTRSSEWSCSHY